MAKFFQSGKWKKRTLTALSVALAASLSLGVLSACGGTTEDEDKTTVTPTDEQLLKNGNFEFYGDKTVEKVEDKLNIISTPDSWTFTSGSPSSLAKSGIIDSDDWNYFTRSGGYSFTKHRKSEDDEEEIETFQGVAEAFAHWEDKNVSAYDRLKFLQLYKTEVDALASTSAEAQLFAKYKYTITYDDVKNLAEEVGNQFGLHNGVNRDEGETSVLMIHNDRTADDGTRGTAQYYTSSTTITLAAGTAAEVSVWVKTAALYHYKDVPVAQRAGAYIGVTNTVGGSTLDQMQIYNINTGGEWEQYTVYVRASTFATSTFRIVLGLGQGSSDDKYYAVDGYAFFDDVTCDIISQDDYLEKAHAAGVAECTVDSLKEEKRFDVDDPQYGKFFALDLFAGFSADHELLGNVTTDLTKEVSGRNTYDSERIDSSLGHDTTQNFTGLTSLADIAGNTGHAFLKNVYENDLKDKFPFENDSILMLLSGNGAAYTAKLQAKDGADPENNLFTLQPNTRLLVSFFVKTSKIGSGLSGASATLVDGQNKTVINPFDSTKIATVDIDSKSDNDADKDIYKGWVQCFFFIENDTDEMQKFSLELSYGPTTIVGTDKFNYGDGYAAFANFEIKSLTKTEYSYASTGDRAKKVSLTGETQETKRFDTVSATAEKTLETALALPANFRGVLGGSDAVQFNETSVPNVKPEGTFTGLLSSKYAKNYVGSDDDWKSALDSATGNAGITDANAWWSSTFGNARQPLVIVNRDAAAYGYFADDTATVSSTSYQRINMRVKASVGAVAYIYLTDTTVKNAGKPITVNLPGYTYWYDDDGHICASDPTDEDFDEETGILYELQENGLYKKVGETNGTYYANLHNYEQDSEGNLVTRDQTVAFYYRAADKKYYAYYNEDTESYSTPVENLPTDIARYPFAEQSLPAATIRVEGTGDWVDVSFFLHTGNEAKTYRLEVWSGNREGTVTNPANSYVFFDNYSSASTSNFESFRDLAVENIKDALNGDKEMKDPDYLGKDSNLPEAKANSFYNALYYTFTFYDANFYLRYDVNEDEDELGNPYGSYTQSGFEEQLVYLYYKSEENGQTSYSVFIDYSATDVTVEKDDLSTDNSSSGTDTDTPASETNIWLVFASGILAVVLIAVIILILVQRLVKKFGKKAKIKAAKDKRYRPNKNKATESDEPEEMPDETDEE